MTQQPTRNQITAWVARHFDYKSRRNGAELVICNPFDGDDGYHFNISVEKAVCHDWRGDTWAGPVNPRTGKRPCSFVNFVKKYLNCSYYQAVAAIVEASPDDGWPSAMASHQRDVAEVTYDQVVLPAGCERITTSSQKVMADIVRRWLLSRGVDNTMVVTHDINHLGLDVYFPYYEYGSLVYWQSRSAVDKVFRFPSEADYGVTKGQFLYNFDNLEPASHVIVTESIFGCYSVGEQCCASGGADLTDMQVKKIKLLGPRDGVILAPDNDQAGIKSIIRNGSLLQRLGLTVLYSLPPELPFVSDGDKLTKDWNELYTDARLSMQDIRAVFENGITLLDARSRIKLLSLAAMYDKRKLRSVDTMVIQR